ncbi:MAG: exodeoxyribonuclease VII large subunit [Alphaproteobacteria bacterium]|nr:exodeoxyribonuclease VII large subunit [Alphaproteobacteria bacterium]
MSEPARSHNQTEYTVSEVSARIKRVVEENFGHVRVRGEISGFKRAASGHLYMALKDANAVMDAVCWKGTADRFAFKPEDGLEVVCVGRITTYPGRSKYQIVIDHMEPAGLGALMALLEKRKIQLEKEGLFDSARKKPIPFLPEVIGVVTSPTGAVIRDILHRLADRFPRHVLVWPVLVQGEGAKEQIAAAITGFNRLPADGAIPRPDLIIVARGGGSLEDLWAFNEEIVVRAAAASDIPLISAVGHETDTTLIDYASDLRAPTPTAAAEMAVPVRSEWLITLAEQSVRMRRSLLRLLEERRVRIEGLARGLPNPRQLLDAATQRLDDLSTRLQASLPVLLQRKHEILLHLAARMQPRTLLRDIARNLETLTMFSERAGAAYKRFLMQQEKHITSLAQLLESYHYKKVLARGFALVRGDNGTVLTSAGMVQHRMTLALEFHDGIAHAIGSCDAATPSNPTKKRPAKKAREQEELF